MDREEYVKMLEETSLRCCCAELQPLFEKRERMLACAVACDRLEKVKDRAEPCNVMYEYRRQNLERFMAEYETMVNEMLREGVLKIGLYNGREKPYVLVSGDRFLRERKDTDIAAYHCTGCDTRIAMVE